MLIHNSCINYCNCAVPENISRGWRRSGDLRQTPLQWSMDIFWNYMYMYMTVHIISKLKYKMEQNLNKSILKFKNAVDQKSYQSYCTVVTYNLLLLIYINFVLCSSLAFNLETCRSVFLFYD